MTQGITKLMRNGVQRRSRSGDLVWRIRYRTYNGDESVQRERHFAGSKRDAKAMLHSLIEDANTRKADPSSMTLAECLAHWLESNKPEYTASGDHVLGVSEKVHARYENTVRCCILPAFGKRVRVQDVTTGMITKAWRKLLTRGRKGNAETGEWEFNDDGKTLSPKTIKNCQGVLSSALRWAKIEGIVGDVATVGAQLPRLVRKEPNMLSVADQRTLIKSLDGHWLQPIVIVALGTGMRLGEILGLFWGSIDWDSQRLEIKQSASFTYEKGPFIKTPKTSAGYRKISLVPEVLEVLRDYRRNRPISVLDDADQPVFDALAMRGFSDKPDEQLLGELIPTHIVSDHFRRHVQKLRIPRVRFHDLRHIHASALLQKGKASQTVAGRLGHSSANITHQIYGHLMPNSDAEMMADFNSEHLSNKK